MFGIGYSEMFLIAVVALIVFGPGRLPEVAGQVGRWVRDFRRMSSELTGEFEKTIAEVDEVRESVRREVQGIQKELTGSTASRPAVKPGAAKTGAAARVGASASAK